MKPNPRILTLALLFGVAFWVLDGIMDALFFYDESVWSLLLLDVPPHELLTRTLFVAALLAFGTLLYLAQDREDASAGREREAAYDAILSTAIDGFWVVGPEGRILEANQAAADMLGYSIEEVTRLSVWEVDATESREDAERRIREVMENDSHRFETRHRRRDGSEIEVEISATHLPDASGRFVAFVRNIGRRKAAQRALQEREELFRTLFENMSSGVAIYHPVDEGQDFVLVDLNQAGQSLSRITREEVVGRRVTEVFPGIARLGLLEVFHRVWKTGVAERHPLTLYEDERVSQWVENYVFRLPPGMLVAMYEDTTEARRAEAAIRESEERLRSIVEHSTNVFYAHTPDHVLTYLSPRIEQLIGIKPAEAMVRWTELTTDHPKNDEALRITQRALDTGEAQPPYEAQLRHRDGHSVWVEVREAPVVVGGRTVSMVGALVDITDRVRAEEALRESEATLRSIIRVAPTGIGLVRDRVLVELNEVVCNMVGRDRSELLGRNARILYPSDEDYEFVGREKYRQIREHGTGTVETRWQHKDGSILHILMSSTPIDAHDLSRGVTFTALDITERTKAEEALRSSETRFRSVIEQSNDAVYLVVGNRFDLVNERFCELTGLSPQEATHPDFTLWELLAPESVPLVKARQEKRSRGEEVPSIYEFTILRRDGRRVQVEASTKAIDYGGQSAVLGTLRDVTDQRNLEAQLHIAQKIEAIGRLSGGVAHDLNNLLSPVLGYGEMLLDGFGPGDERRESAEQIIEAGLRARELVRQLLAFSRKQTLEFRPIDLVQVIQNFERLLRRTIREDIDIKLQMAPDLPTILADIGQLEQVVMNLAVNAQDAMPHGGTLTMRAAPCKVGAREAASLPGLKPGKYVRMEVVDTGSGMDAATMERIFEPFFTTKEIGRGTGLGLATVYGIVKQHGGGIWVESHPGKGSVFRCYFPVAGEEAAPPPPSRQGKSAPGGTESVVVVEDEEMVRELTVRFLKRLGYSVLSAGNAEECLRLLTEEGTEPDILLTDVVLPGMNGRALSEQVRAVHPRTRILFMSGYSDDVVSHHGILDDGIAFLHKPFSIHALAAKMREVLDHPIGG